MIFSRWWLNIIGVLLFPGSAQAWEIASFDTQVQIHRDATATITETILADFKQEARHGIYRDIPVHARDRAGQPFRMRLEIEEITDDSGRALKYHSESTGPYHRIRIGDPDLTLSGRQTYRIIYKVKRGAVRFFPDHDECYWNLTGNEWAVPIRKARGEIRLPDTVKELRAIAYLGSYGSTAHTQHLHTFVDHVVIEPSEGLEPYEGLTAAVAWEKGLVQPPSGWRIFRWWIEDNWMYGLVLLVLSLMTALWSARGREVRLETSPMVQYEPPKDVSPAELGTLIDQRVNLRDITATVIDLAVRGYLRIIKAKRFGGWDYQLVSLKPWEQDPHLKPHERMLLKGIFDVSETSIHLSDLNEVFYQKLPKIRDQLYQGLIEAGYLDSHPDRIRSRYHIFGWALGISLFFGLQALEHSRGIDTITSKIASALCGLIIIVFGLFMPRRTLKGAQTTEHIFGFLEFLRRTDQDRLRQINDPSLFERFLPYALALGVADRWTRVFEGLYTQPPSWYVGSWDHFSARQLGQDITQATSSMGHSFTSAPRSDTSGFGGGSSGGGGFSGGGGGGGGGGAW